MFVLALDTSSPAVTAGVVTVGEGNRMDPAAGDAPGQVVLAAERAPLAARGHGELLATAVADCLLDAAIGLRDLTAVVVGVGPGPFTGLRVGLVTAAALADVAGLPTYAVCSLDALAEACADEERLLVATDARRREVYWATYARGVRTSDPGVARPADVPLDGLTAVAGAGGELYQDVWPALTRRPERYPDPVALVRCALPRLAARAAGEPLTPLYLRRPDAVEPGRPKTVTQS